MVFTIISSGYHPRCALDATDGAEIRVGKIATMIGECDWGIHDLSRIEVDAAGMPRLPEKLPPARGPDIIRWRWTPLDSGHGLNDLVSPGQNRNQQ
jgi:hypothetical protein